MSCEGHPYKEVVEAGCLGRSWRLSLVDGFERKALAGRRPPLLKIMKRTMTIYPPREIVPGRNSDTLRSRRAESSRDGS